MLEWSGGRGPSRAARFPRALGSRWHSVPRCREGLRRSTANPPDSLRHHHLRLTPLPYPGQVRSVDLSFTPAEEAFRADLRAWLRANLPPGWGSGDPPEHATLADEVAFLRAWQQKLARGGWVGIHWPREVGGRGATVVEKIGRAAWR